MTDESTPGHDELWRHLDWSFWGTGMADTFREPLAEAMLAGITSEQRQQANDLITRWRDHREFVGRDKYEAQKAEIEQLRTERDELRLILAQHVGAAIALGTRASAWAAGSALAELLDIHSIDLTAEYTALQQDDDPTTDTSQES